MNHVHETMSGASVAGIIILSIVAVILVGAVVAGLLISFDKEDRLFGRGIVITAAVAAVIAAGGAAWAWYPYGHEYHYWIRHTGTVAQTESRLMADSSSTNGGSTTVVVVTLVDGFTGRCDDGRCLGAHQGDTISLDCKREWQYSGTDGYECTFVSLTASAKP